MESTEKYKIMLGDECIGESHAYEIPVSKETGWEYYMRRKNVLYFRNKYFGQKIAAHVDEIPKELKYGFVSLQYSFA